MSMGTKTALTPDDLLLLPEPENGRHYELSDGELIVVGHVGWRHERIKSITLSLLIVYLEKHPIGSAFSDSQFTMAGGGRAFRVSRSSATASWRRYRMEISPSPSRQIWRSIISNSEIAARAEKKVREYLASGVQEVWQVYPADRFVRVRTAEGIRDLAEDQLLETPVLPGFQVNVQAFFAR
jgi:Uma2 family endonuclease